MRRVVAVAALVLVAACGSDAGAGAGSGSSGPAAAVEKLMHALDDGDCRAAKKLVVTPSELGCDDVEQAAGSFADEGNDLSVATFTASPVEGSSATVMIDWGNDHPGESYDVQRIAGGWLVVFDSVA